MTACATAASLLPFILCRMLMSAATIRTNPKAPAVTSPASLRLKQRVVFVPSQEGRVPRHNGGHQRLAVGGAGHTEHILWKVERLLDGPDPLVLIRR